jgi:glycosyltransferase involved in cell wall biosynthesis|tara:strand:+ start:1003 stop:2268 length:1266 start_codon:yes stop_codon:yes gene_type:complete
MSKKIKVLTLSDHPLSPSGVGTQTKYVIEALLNSGEFEVLSLGGAIKHNDYTPRTVDEWGEEWRIIPVDGYGNQEMIRSIIRNERPDILWFMTDPRFYGWLWEMENEIRPLLPMVYYHVWDNKPLPMFNKKFYESNDHIATISRITQECVTGVAPEVPSSYLPHAVDSSLFRPVTLEEKMEIRSKIIPDIDSDKFIVFWNNRNARRKQSGTLLWWWSEWIDKRSLSGKAQLIMHTNPYDAHGQNLNQIATELGMTNREVVFSTKKLGLETMPLLYTSADCTINIADAEGFGLATLESLSCATPIIVNMTGGLQEQIMGIDGPFGFPIYPTSKSIIGSQQVPYIYEDRISKEQVFSALDKMYALSKEDRHELGLKGSEHVKNNYNFENFNQRWVNLMRKIHNEEGSWDTRKGYDGITFKEVA